MGKYRNALPQLGGNFFMTDGGIETTLIFHEGQDLPYFAAFHLLQTPEGENALRSYFRSYGRLARLFNAGLILESATWRASADWGEKLGYSASSLAEVNQRAIRILEEVRSEIEAPHTPVVISGCVGPRGDGYVVGRTMSVQEAEMYHRTQIELFGGSAADLVTAITMNYAEEAIGIVRAARDVDMPVVISFTVETDGKLPSGQPLDDAIRFVDDATSTYPAYFMINCAHPTHFTSAIDGSVVCAERVRGLRANASRLSHAELDMAAELDAGDPLQLASEYAELKVQHLKLLNVMGGCCGTDHRHVEQIALRCMPLFT
jgi:S-methylmethionine-dependent homocysteine/selenocysteine methylase